MEEVERLQTIDDVFQNTNLPLGNCTSRFWVCFQLIMRFQIRKCDLNDFIMTVLTDSNPKEHEGMKYYSSAAI